jgi:hypothetical protein
VVRTPLHSPTIDAVGPPTFWPPQQLLCKFECGKERCWGARRLCHGAQHPTGRGKRFVGNRLFLYTAKTGVPVHVVVPEFVLRILESTPRKSENHFFWSGVGKLESIVRSWQTRLRRLFQIAGVAKGHAHRLRDTFAVELLLAGVPIERVSILLGHQSTRVTEKHYNPWVRSRQEQLEADLERAWSRDPLVLVEGKATQRLRGERARVN